MWDSMVPRVPGNGVAWLERTAGPWRVRVKAEVSLESQAKELEPNLEDMRCTDVLLTGVVRSIIQFKEISRCWKEVDWAAGV